MQHYSSDIVKRPQNLKKKSHLISTTLNNNVKTTWKILSKFCGLLTISELYEECELRKDFTPLSVSSMMQ
jgi:hypothetical protein